MPLYNLKNTETEEVFEKFMKISEMETFLSENPHIQQWHESAPSMSYNDVKKPDSGFREVLQKIKSKHKGNTINDWWWIHKQTQQGSSMKRTAKTAAKKVVKINSLGLELREINPMTETQNIVFRSFYDNHLLLHGIAGTGKTFISLYLALKEMLEYGTFKKIYIVRSAVATRDVGFMPGTLDEKLRVYEQPYREIVNNLLSRGDAYDILKSKNVIEFMSTSFIRGLTIDNAVVIVDEIQNLSFAELDSVITRVGEGTKIVFCGDFRQTDLKNAKEKTLHKCNDTR